MEWLSCLDMLMCSCALLPSLTNLSRSGTRFVPKAEERLLAVVHALLHRCYKMPFSNNAEVPASLKKELSGGPTPVTCEVFVRCPRTQSA